MSGDKTDIELAEERMKALAHSEQHYFKRCVMFFYARFFPQPATAHHMLTVNLVAMITMVRRTSPLEPFGFIFLSCHFYFAPSNVGVCREMLD